MAVSSMQKINSLIKSTVYGRHSLQDQGTGPIVTIARDFGAGGNEVGEFLAEQLKTPFIDRKLLDLIVEKTHTDVNLIERLDERLPTPFEDWIMNMIGRSTSSKSEYLGRLVIILKEIGRHGGVIMGRGAHLVLGNKRVFRLRVVGSLEKCAHRIVQREGISSESALKRVKEVNEQRKEFVRNIYKHYPTEATYYDLVINTDRLHSRQVADLALDAMERMGFDISEGQQVKNKIAV